jgi:hypothetical protein
MNTRPRQSVAELDLLRGLAIVLMVVNHAGYRLLDAPDALGSAVAPLVFSGSFAPVVFFFATGFGVALARSGSAAGWSGFGSTLVKAALLLLADQFLFWKQGRAWGLDFLGFIAIATVLVSAVATRRAALRWAVGGIVAVLVLRFGVGPLTRELAAQVPLVAWFTGALGLPGISYPFAPWVVYPLLGYVAARAYLAAARPRWLGAWLLAAALLPLAAAWALDRQGASFLRWSHMNLPYFVLSLGVLAVVLAASVALASATPRLSRWLSLRGTASLAVVPIHYALIEAASAFGGVPMSPLAWLAWSVALVAGSIALAKGFAAAIDRWLAGVRSPAGVGYILGGVVVVCIVAIWTPGIGVAGAFALFIAAQLAIAALLAVRDRARRSADRGVALPASLGPSR